MEIEVKTKRCPRCGETKPVNDFYRDKNRKDGRSYCCAVCSRQLSKKNRDRKRKEMGDEAWRARQREITRRHRSKLKGRAPYNEAYQAALYRLKEVHADTFLHLLNEERYKRGLEPKS